MIVVARRRPPVPPEDPSWLEPLDAVAGPEPSLDCTDFRKAVSLFATGIVVLTCEDEDGRIHGVTVNSFTSVSLSPPTVLVSLKPGKAHRLISRSGRYGACVLNEAQQHFSTHFAGKPQDELQPDFVTRDRVPTLRNCLAWFECAVIERIQIHDHTLFVAEVTGCGTQVGTPLMFFGSRYHRPDIKL